VISQFNRLGRQTNHPRQAGVRNLARILGMDKAPITRWRKTGHIPSQKQKRILELAQKYGLDLTEKDIIWGRTIEA
jgi:hypothetical protein